MRRSEVSVQPVRCGRGGQSWAWQRSRAVLSAASEDRASPESNAATISVGPATRSCEPAATGTVLAWRSARRAGPCVLHKDARDTALAHTWEGAHLNCTSRLSLARSQARLSPRLIWSTRRRKLGRKLEQRAERAVAATHRPSPAHLLVRSVPCTLAGRFARCAWSSAVGTRSKEQPTLRSPSDPGRIQLL